jgi:predicted RNA-binding protein with PIN domain
MGSKVCGVWVRRQGARRAAALLLSIELRKTNSRIRREGRGRSNEEIRAEEMSKDGDGKR